ncbi:MAG: hypothetical protein RLZZ488_1187 [Pseudomonadota bacterium]|jgi:diaminopimelate epimerase
MSARLSLLREGFSFEKWHGARNDFLLAEANALRASFGGRLESSTLERLAVDFCDRTTGLGADGLVVWQVERDGQLSAAIWNSDGSRAGTCGNALRCLAAAVLSLGHWDGCSPLPVFDFNPDEVQTPAHMNVFATLLNSQLTHEDSGLFESAVGMGEVVEYRDLPLSTLTDSAFLGGTVAQELLLAALQNGSFVRLANPHLVLVLKAGTFRKLTNEHFAELGQLMQSKGLCSALGIPLSNIGFVGLPENSTGAPLDAIVYERGAGLTQCCGSGGCAIQVTLEKTQNSQTGTAGSFAMPGGVISILNRSGTLHLSGPAQRICRLTLS